MGSVRQAAGLQDWTRNSVTDRKIKTASTYWHVMIEEMIEGYKDYNDYIAQSTKVFTV